MIKRALVGVLVLVLLAAGTARADSPVTLADYRRTVEQALALVNQASALMDTGQRASLLGQAATLLDTVHQVQLAGDEQRPVDNSALVAELKAAAQNAGQYDRIQAAQARLNALHSAIDNAPATNSAADRAKLSALLNRPPFKATQLDDPISRLLQQILDQIARLLFGTAQGVANLRDILIPLGVIVVVGILLFFIYHMMVSLTPETRLSAAGEDVPLTSAQALVQARRLASEGDYRSAVRGLYLATLLLLDEHGRLRYDRSLTNREYLRAVANEPQVLAALQPIVEVFDRTWYGFESISREDFEAYQRRVQDLQKL